ncbi:MAG: aminoacyl-tRNA hydrolase [Salinisphaeraceae bacterium]|nr:aminoacyl-tRNA hydrolase [Salinisphaeraceae bacterium]
MAQVLRAVVGLGNPGDKHAQDRHNAGFWFADALAERQGVAFKADKKLLGDIAKLTLNGQDLYLLKPSTFMNRSGQAVQALMSYFKLKPAEILVVHDELDLPPGTARLKLGGGHGGNNGLRDTITHIGADFRRLRIGIGHPGHKDRVLGHVLGKPNKDQEAAMLGAIESGLHTLDIIMQDGWDKATQFLHTQDK